MHRTFAKSLLTLSAVVFFSNLAYAQQQPLRPANFGAPEPAKEGNWISKRLPWNKGDKPAPAPERESFPTRHVSPAQKRIGQFSMGRLAEKRDQNEAAKSVYESLIKKDPTDYKPYHRLGVMAAKSGDVKRSASLLSHARKLNPRDPEVTRDLGYLYYKEGHLKNAEAFYREGLKISPKHQGLNNNLAILLAETGRYKESLEIFKRVNKPAQAHANMGFMLAQIGHLDKAEGYFNHALTLDKDLKSAAHGLMQTVEIRQRAEALKAQSEQVAAQSQGAGSGRMLPGSVEATLSDAKPAATASRIAVAQEKPSQSQVQVVTRTEPRVEQPATTATTTATPLNRAVRIEPTRVGVHNADSNSLRNLSNPTDSRRSVVGTKNAETSVTAPGPARQRNSLRIRSSATSSPQTDQPGPTQIRTATAKPAQTEASSATAGLPRADNFGWSTSKFPTARPTWTSNSNAAKTEVPSTLSKEK